MANEPKLDAYAEEKKSNLSDYEKLFKDNYNNMVSQLDTTYNNNLQQLNNNLENDKRQAYFNQQKILKYLPNNLKANGLQNNIGATSQAYLDANNNYMNQLAQINQNYNQNKNTLSDIYNTNKNTLTDTYNRDILGFARESAENLENVYKPNIAERASYFNLNEYGKFNQEDIDKLYDYVDKEATLLSESDKDALRAYIANNYQVASQDEINDYTWKNRLVTNYGVSTDDTGIDNSIAGVLSFGKFNDTGKGSKNGAKQDPYVLSILEKARKGEVPNGTIVNMNYGKGTPANFVYYNGKWYKTNNSATYTYKDWESGKSFNSGSDTNMSASEKFLRDLFNYK